MRRCRYYRLAPLVGAGLATLLLPAAAAAAGAAAVTGIAPIKVIAGSGDIGDGRPATAAALAGIGGLAVDRQGNLYFSEIGRNRVRRVDAETGLLSTVAGTGGVETTATRGAAVDFDVFTPGPLALDAAGEALFIGEVAGKRVLRVELATGELSDFGAPPSGFRQLIGLLWTPEALLAVDTVAGQVWRRRGDSWEPVFANPNALAGGIRHVVQDRAGDFYLSEFFGHRLLRWDRETGEVATIAGEFGVPGRSPDGTPAAQSLLRTPDGLAIDAAGNLYFSDMNNHRIARIDHRSGELTTHIASPRSGGALRWSPGSLFLDHRGGLWVGDAYGNRVLRFAPGSATPEVVAGGGSIGDGGPADRAILAHPGCLAVDRHGNVYVADALHHRVRRIDAASGRIETVAGTGVPGYNGDHLPATEAQVNYPGGLLVDGADRLYIADYYNNRVRVVEPKSGLISTVAGSGAAGDEGNGGPAAAASMLNPHALTFDAAGRLIVTSAVVQSVRTVDLERGVIDGVALDPRMVPSYRALVFYDVAFGEGGFYLADGMRDQVLFVEPGKTTRVVGRPDIHYPMGLAVSPRGELYISDTRNNRVVRWTGSGVEVVVENLGRPRGIAFDAQGRLYVADTFHNQVLRVDLPAAVSAPAAAGAAPAAAGGAHGTPQ